MPSPRPTSPRSPAPPSPAQEVRVADLAREAGVSSALVYSFLSGSFYGNQRKSSVGIAGETQERIIAACRTLGYRPDNPLLLLRVYPTLGEYAFLLGDNIVDGIANPYFSLMFAGLVASLSDQPHSVDCAQFSASTDYLTHPAALSRVVRSERANKFIVCGAVNYSLLHALQRRGGQIVYLARFVDLPGVVSIVPDFFQAAHLSVQHLVAQGHRQIAVVAESYFHADAYPTVELTRGFTTAMQEHRLPFQPDDIFHHASREPSAPADTLARLLDRHPATTALACFDDGTAIGMVRAASARGLVIPRDLSLVGCNDERTAAYCNPALTTIHVPAKEMGQQAVAELDRLVRLPAPAPSARKIVVPVSLVTRHTVAAPQQISSRPAESL